MKVTNMTSDRGNSVPNQFIIKTYEETIFQSYDSIIVKIFDCSGVKFTLLDEKYWNYSKTTAKYRNQFLGETTKQIKAKIDNGTYKLVNLN